MVNIAKLTQSSHTIISLMVFEVHILPNKVKYSHAANLFCCFYVHELCGKENVSEIKKSGDNYSFDRIYTIVGFCECKVPNKVSRHSSADNGSKFRWLTCDFIIRKRFDK